jgi:hypothetical protein
MFLAGAIEEKPSVTGGIKYALKKLNRWKPEGPTERNRQMARCVLDRAELKTYWSGGLSTEGSLLVDLALEWGDFPMWEEVLKKSAGGKFPPRLSSDILLRAWSVFTFDRIKHTSVHSTFHPSPVTLPIFLSLTNVAGLNRLSIISLAQWKQSSS